MSNVVKFPGATIADIPPANILDGALAKGLADVLVIGWDKDGQFYFAGSSADGGNALWLMELAKRELIG